MRAAGEPNRHICEKTRPISYCCSVFSASRSVALVWELGATTPTATTAAGHLAGHPQLSLNHRFVHSPHTSLRRPAAPTACRCCCRKWCAIRRVAVYRLSVRRYLPGNILHLTSRRLPAEPRLAFLCFSLRADGCSLLAYLLLCSSSALGGCWR